MVLEATMIVIDNSEYMRNGDYHPTRLGAQSDAVNVIFTRKTNANPENTVGLMTMAGKTPQVLVTPTTDIGKILTALHNTNISETADIHTGLQVAQLALKHRQNKTQRQRIIAFVGSPLSSSKNPNNYDEKSLTRLAKKLKKNNVAVDIVCFGEEEEVEENEAKLKAFVDTVQSGENSHYLAVPTGSHLLSDVIIQSPILREEGDMAGGFGEGSGAGGSGGGDGFEFGVDPSLDPELAMALRMSLEEERARLAAQTTSSAAPAAAGEASSTLQPIPESIAAPANLMDQDDEDEQLTQALLLSKGGPSAGDEDVEMGDESSGGGATTRGNDEELSEEEAIQKAIAMSMQEDEEEEKKN
ncbi:hypothetical protein FRC03_000543 [Tulasnella sp. 419]|nr:hypothetical protein FRC03_000543 [Tulasnella sp. 419]